MSARIAELLVREEALSNGKAKEACRKEISTLICQLKAERNRRDSDSPLNKIAKDLRVLVDAGDHSYWYRTPRAPLDLTMPSLSTMDADTLISRLIALHDEQREIALLLGTDGITEESAQNELKDLDPALISNFLQFKANVLSEKSNSNTWRTELKKAATKKYRFDILERQFSLLVEESLRVLKEISRRL